MTEGLTAAIVGLSWIGADPPGDASDPILGTAIPYSHASAYASVPRVTRLVGCDPSPDARATFEKNWRDRYPDLRVYADLEALLASEAPDIVSVVTPDHRHAAVLLRVLEAGVRMVFCEKPIATSLTEADAMVTAVNDAGATVAVNYTRRWQPDTVEIRTKVRTGAIGDLSHVISQLGSPRAMLFRNLTHSIDLLNYFADAEPEWVVAELEPGFEQYGTAYQGNGQNPDLEPSANAYVAYANGVRGFLNGAKTMTGGEALQLSGSGGRIILDPEGIRMQRPGPEGIATQRLTPAWTVAGMTGAVLDIIRSREAGVPTQSPPEHARRAVAITTAILESQARGNARIAITPYRPEK